ncbi:XAC2610-related protein [Flavisolibacter tropicus]|uniref:Uncharacterized protein n=1 Tax=Flavisolibacter tropicus TaxID=1492898 RepID=A0A172TZC2_9BACT|nr:hypothetical protein [Flavisolibacter tropicus]ANE52298.1 hypothetical protein SY85_19220 [Flavisolibacter tropicus]
MKPTLFLLTILLASYNLLGQTSYTGYIDKYPIELVANIFSDGDIRAIYAYSNFDEPIVINGKLLQGRLTLFEKDKMGNNKATLTFENFNTQSDKLEGNWTDLGTGKQLKISLTKSFAIDQGNNIEWKDRELLQPVSLGDNYFKLIVSKAKDEFYARVTGIKILEKKTDRLIQQIDLECQLMGLNNVNVDDYNFDGIDDFSVFESSYAGPNTSSLYFLYNRKTGKYFDSGFSGTSLEFDSKAKRIYERNQCCAGASVTTAEYKVVNNKMVLLKERCFKWDEKKQELVERNIKDCQ